MKNTLLIASLTISLFSFGQKKLTSSTVRSEDETGTNVFLDSSKHNYSTWNGSINELKMKFGFDGDIMYYLRPEIEEVPCDQVLRYFGNSYPLTLTQTTQNTVALNQITMSEIDGTYRILTTYNSAGHKTLIKSQSLNGSIWETMDSLLFTVDGMGNQLTRTNYQFTPTPTLYDVDSSWYVPGTKNLMKYTRYSLNSTSNLLEVDYQTINSWTGNNVQNCDLYSNPGSGSLVWDYRLTYTYTAANPINFIAYPVTGNVPTTTVFANGYFQYNAQNLISSYLLTFGTDTSEYSQYQYDADGFITQRNQQYGGSSQGLFSKDIYKYFYENTADLQELEVVNVSIYPNPAQNYLTVKAEGNITTIQILNLSGQILLEQNAGELEISHLPAGTYIVRGQTDRGVFSKQIIKN
jgi:hypothetical protein